MGKYRIEIKRSAARDIKKLPARELNPILKKISALADDPRPADCVKLSGEEKYRIRCGNYRILYQVEDRVLIVIVVKVGHRRDIYRKRQ